MAGRDRAISKWNTDVATTGSGIDKVLTKSDPITAPSSAWVARRTELAARLQ